MQASLQNGQPSADAQTPRQQPQRSHVFGGNDESHTSQQSSHPTRDEVQESADVVQNSAPETVAQQQPRLTPSRSAPAEIDAMVHQTPSQDAIMVRAASFHGFVGGDTQPMESQIYRDYTESMIRSSGTTPKKTILHASEFVQNEQNTYETGGAGDKTQLTTTHGDDGFVDLDMAWQPADSPTAKSATSGIEDLLAGPESQSQNQGANGNFAPRTPGLAGSKRRRSGEIPTSATDASRRTPGIAEAFAFNNATKYSATQLFNQTQAPSSPMIDMIRSDPVAERPSPNLHINRNLLPDMASSSPVLMMHNPPASTAGEPRDTYTSMRESQERRAARLRQELDLSKRFGPEAIAELDEEEDEDSQQLRMERKRLQRVMSEHASDEWSKYRAPSRLASNRSSDRKRTATIDLVTPGTLHKQNRVQFEMSDNEQETDDENMEIDLPVEAEDNHDGEGLHDDEGVEVYEEDNDVYDEYSQTVLRSQRDPEDEDVELSVHEDEDRSERADERHNVEETTDQDGNGDGGDTKILNGDQNPGDGVPSTQPAVADSQPERLNIQRSLLSKEPIGPPNTSSIIPGSQYVGATSQELARHSARVPHSTMSQPLIGGSTKSQHEDSRVPSSPPMPSGYSEGHGDDEGSTTPRQTSVQGRPGHAPEKYGRRLEREIPESDQPGYDNAESAKGDTAFETAAESNAPAPYSTAQTHLGESAPTPEKPRLVKEASKVSASQHSMPTPLKAAGVRRFADIAADPSPPEFSAGSQLDMDAIMGNVITMDDQNFMAALSSPPSEKPTKRRRLLQSESRRRSYLPSTEATSSAPESETAREASPAKPVADIDEPVEDVRTAASEGAVNPSRSSPERPGEQPSATPKNSSAPDTPESVRRREEAGSKAASQLLSTRRSASATKKPGKRENSGRKTSDRKSVSRQPSSKLKKSVEQPSDEAPSRDTKKDLQQEEGGVTRTEDVKTPSALETTEHGSASAPHRILALFRGASYNAYYPATWLSTSADGSRHRLRFDDTTVTTLDDGHVRALEFRIGDAVKVDYEGFRSKTWLVKAFGRKAQNEDDRANGVDIHDHVTLLVQAKVTQRSSMATPSAIPQGEGEMVEIMVTNVKITHNMITHFADRVFHPPNKDDKTRTGTPLTDAQSADNDTPSRSRRPLASATKSAARDHSKLREESVFSASEPKTSGMFDGMAFAISYASNENEKFEVTRVIQRNGGIILDQGFDELFVQPQLSEPTTPTKRSSKKPEQQPDAEASGGLRLKPEYEDLGFIALIADKHSRRAKYMQALALEIPTLSGRWVLDSCDSARNAGPPSQPRPWTRYLLAAGESSYLGGAIRSRTLQYYDPKITKLTSTVASRPLLLNGSGVLIISPKKGKGTWERRKAYAFLTLALGAGSVRRVADLAEAKKLLATDQGRQKWAWVYVDDDVSEAAKALFGAKGAQASKKRKRAEGPLMCVEGMGGSVKVVGDEFVVQSLILGALVD